MDDHKIVILITHVEAGQSRSRKHTRQLWCEDGYFCSHPIIRLQENNKFFTNAQKKYIFNEESIISINLYVVPYHGGPLFQTFLKRINVADNGDIYT